MKNQEKIKNKHYKILLVDDQETVLETMESRIKPLGYRIFKAKNGKEAIAVLATKRPDLILSDVMMPEMDGFELCSLIKSSREYKNIPVVMVTSLNKTKDMVKALECGADDFLPKSVNPIELKARIKSLLNKKILSDKVNFAYKHISDLTMIADTTLTSISYETFSPDHSRRDLASKLLKTDVVDIDKPAQIFIGKRRKNHDTPLGSWHCEGDLYAFESGKIDIHQLNLNISLKEKNHEIETVNCDNFDYLGLFERDFVKQIGSIRNYIIYKPEETDDILIAFNYGVDVTEHEAGILRSFMLLSHVFTGIAEQMDEVDNAFRYLVNALARAAEANDEDTGNHLLRVNEYSAILAKELNMPDKYVRDIGFLAQMHDVGKVHVPASVLKKPGKLTDEEFSQIKSHPNYGAKIIGDEPRLEMAREIALHHHERFDGTGYPNRVKGEDIPISARIVAIADVYDALRSQRCYKPPFSHEKTFDIITKGDGRMKPEHFDPQAIEAFIRKEREFERVFDALSQKSDEDKNGS